MSVVVPQRIQHRLGQFLAQHRLEPRRRALGTDDLAAAVARVAPVTPAPSAAGAVRYARRSALWTFAPILFRTSLEASNGDQAFVAEPAQTSARFALLKSLPPARSAWLGSPAAALGADDVSHLSADVALNGVATLRCLDVLQSGARGCVIRLDLQHAAQTIGGLIVIIQCAGKPQPGCRVERVVRYGFGEQATRGLSTTLLHCRDAKRGEFRGVQGSNTKFKSGAR